MPSDSTTVLHHIVAILDCFSANQPELGVREVARLANVSSSTAGRLMAEMKQIGILQQNSNTRGYSLGSKLLAWSGVYMDTLDLRSWRCRIWKICAVQPARRSRYICWMK